MTRLGIRVVFPEQRKRSAETNRIGPKTNSSFRAYNDMLYLCEKYAPLDSLERYRPENDVSVTGAYVQHETHAMRDAHLNQISVS